MSERACVCVCVYLCNMCVFPNYTITAVAGINRRGCRGAGAIMMWLIEEGLPRIVVSGNFSRTIRLPALQAVERE